MDNSKVFDINQSVKILPEGSSDEEWFTSTLQDIDETTLYIAVPIRKTVPLMLREGDKVRVRLLNPTGMVIFNTKVVCWRKDAIPLVGLSIPSRYERMERRNFVRLGLLMEILVSEMPESGKEPSFLRTQALDISGGGMRIAWRRMLAPGTHLLVKFALPTGAHPDEFSVEVEVMRILSVGGGGTVQMGVQFINLPTKQQDVIIHYIFNKMSEAGRIRSEKVS